MASSSPKHPWSLLPNNTCRSLGSSTEITEYDSSTHLFASSPFVTVVPLYEAEHIVESLTSFPVEQIGTSIFLKMYAYQLERLSIQAHASAQQSTGDEYIVDAILTYNKLATLITTLLAVEAWRTHILSSTAFIKALATNGNALRCAFILHVETTIVGLINLVLYKREGCESLDEESAIALVDYCARCLVSDL